MKYNLIIVMGCLLGLAACKSTAYEVQVTISYTRPYCGGARPTPEMEEAASRKNPYANQMFYWMQGDKVDSVKTDANGQLKAKLKGEKWVLYEGWQYYNQGPDGQSAANFKAECLEELRRKPLLTINFSKSKPRVDTVLHIAYTCPYAHPCIKEGYAVPE